MRTSPALVIAFCTLASQLAHTQVRQRVAAPTQPTATATDRFVLELPNIPGESQLDGYKGWHDVAGYLLEKRRIDDASGVRIGVSALQVNSNLGTAFPKLLVQCASGKKLPAAKLHGLRSRDNKWETFLELELKDVRVQSVQSVSGPGTFGQSFALDWQELKLTVIRFDEMNNRRERVETSFKRTCTPRLDVAALPGATGRTVDGFLKIPSVLGDATDGTYKDWIKVLQFGLRVVTRPTDDRRCNGPEAPEFGNAEFAVEMTRVLPQVSGLFFTGKQVGTVEFVTVSAGPNRQVALRVKLHDASIQRVRSSANGTAKGSSFEIDYKKIEIEYQPAMGDKVRGCWDRVQKIGC